MEIIRLTLDNKEYAKQFTDVRNLQVKEDTLEIFLKNDQNHACMAIEDNQVLALIWAYTLERMDDGPMMFIYSVDVVEAYRKQGIATTIINKMVGWAKENGYRNSFLITDEDNIAANKLYSRCGGERHDDKVLYIFKE